MTYNLKQRIAEALYPYLFVQHGTKNIEYMAQKVLDIVEPMLSEWKELTRKAWVQLEQVDCNNPLVDELFDALCKTLPTPPEKE